MKSKIIAIGSEEFTLGFELIGIETAETKELEKYLINKEIGIIILEQEQIKTFSNSVQLKINTSIKPIIIALSNTEEKTDILKNQIIRTLGIDLLNN